MNDLNIILLTHNNLPSTKKCIENIYKYTKDFNIFIVENNSIDRTREYLKQLNKNNLYISLQKENLGIIKGRNTGFDFYKSINNKDDYIMFLDSDQYVLEDWQESYIKLFKQGYDVVGIESWKLRKRDYYPYKKITDPKDSFSYVGAGAMMLKSSIFEELGKFDEDRYKFIYFEDPDFCFRAHQAGYKIGWNYNPVIIHDHKGPLLSRENRGHFLRNWKKFREKWEGYEVPVLRM